MPKFSNNPRFLKAKLTSYETFYGIAHSIRLVAFAKLQKLKKKIDSRYVSLKLVKYIISNFYKISSRIINSNSKKVSVLFFTSDSSCCGSINNPILNNTRKLVDNLTSYGILINLFPIGKKGYNIFKKRYKRAIKKKVYDLEMDVNYMLGSYIVFKELQKLKHDEIYIIFARFVNNFLQQVCCYKVPSFNNFFTLIFSDRESNTVLDVLMDRNLAEEGFITDFYSFATSLLILDAFEETDYSQLGAKAKTMELAIQNVSDTINILRIRYNKARQAIITNEIIEILNATVAILE